MKRPALEPVGAREFLRYDNGAVGLSDGHAGLSFYILNRTFRPAPPAFCVPARYVITGRASDDVLATREEGCRRRGHVLVTSTRIIVIEENAEMERPIGT